MDNFEDFHKFLSYFGTIKLRSRLNKAAESFSWSLAGINQAKQF